MLFCGIICIMGVDVSKVSVIVPVYNTERYLPSCLNSLVNQSLEDLEIIAVDDNSSDNSFEILKEYESRYPDKIKVLHNEKNCGQSFSRNLGIFVAKGEYIGFVELERLKDMMFGSENVNTIESLDGLFEQVNSFIKMSQ